MSTIKKGFCRRGGFPQKNFFYFLKKEKTPETNVYILSILKYTMIELDPYQKEVLAHKGDILLCTGRRVGKTYILARKAIDLMIKQPKTPVIVVSLTEDQAMLIIMMALQYLKEANPKMIGRGRDKPTLKTITLTNGSKMISRPVGTTGDAVRGFAGGVLIVDEASRMPEMFWLAARPVLLTTNGQIWIGSTPFGKQGYFWEQFDLAYNKQDPNARFKVFYISSEEVINTRPISSSWSIEQREGAKRILAQEKASMSALQYGQEFLGLFLEDLQQYFPDELINKCCKAKRDEDKGGELYLGVDLARLGGDEITYEVIQKNGKTNFIHKENIVKKEQLTTQTEQDIVALDLSWKFKKIGIDAGSGGLGVGMFDRFMQLDNFKRRIVAMNNREVSLDREGKKRQRIFKEDMYDNLKFMMENGEIILLDDDNIRASLKSVQMEYNEEGQVSKSRIFGSYTHIAEGLVRAAWLAKKEKVNKLWIGYF